MNRHIGADLHFLWIRPPAKHRYVSKLMVAAALLDSSLGEVVPPTNDSMLRICTAVQNKNAKHGRYVDFFGR